MLINIYFRLKKLLCTHLLALLQRANFYDVSQCVLIRLFCGTPCVQLCKIDSVIDKRDSIGQRSKQLFLIFGIGSVIFVPLPQVIGIQEAYNRLFFQGKKLIHTIQNLQQLIMIFLK